MTDLTASQTTIWRLHRMLRIVSLTPFAVPLTEMLFVRNYFPALTVTPPDIVGVPFSLALEALILTWAAVGVAIVWRTRSVPLAQFAVVLFVPTAIAGLVFRPAIILQMQNLTV